MYIPNYQPSLYVTCIYVFMVDHFVLDNQSVCSSLEKAISSVLSILFACSPLFRLWPSGLTTL